MEPIDIAICGCGPAGLAAALFLARAGHRVSIVERFAEPKPLGSGLILQPVGLAVLDALGLGRRIRGLGAPIRRLFGRAVPSGRIVLDVRYAASRRPQTGLAVHRAALFGTLHDACKAIAIPIETSFEVAALEQRPDGRRALVSTGGRRLGPFDLVVDALGSKSVLTRPIAGRKVHRALAYGALWATVPWHAEAFADDTLEQRYRRANVMAGVLPIGSVAAGGPRHGCIFWSLKPAAHDRFLERGIEAWKADVAALWPETVVLLSGLDDTRDLVLARYGHHTIARPVGERVAIIGDAAHSTSPQLGQGANMALLDAAALAVALAGSTTIEPALESYARSRRRHVWIYQAMSAVFTPFYQSDSVVLPLLRDTLVAGVSRVPVVSRLLATLVAGQWCSPLRGLDLAGEVDFLPAEAR